MKLLKRLILSQNATKFKSEHALINFGEVFSPLLIWESALAPIMKFNPSVDAQGVSSAVLR